jgi:ATP synthase F1 gamma subunit
MKQLKDLARQETAMSTLVELTSVFEGIASMRIAQIKDQVLHSADFFNELWDMYTQIRVDEEFNFGRGVRRNDNIDKELYIIITSEGGFSGDIDQKLLQIMLKTYDAKKNDIVVIGHHGKVQLAQLGVKVKRNFKMPVKDKNFNVAPLVQEVQHYSSTKVFYQEYISLMVQDVKRIELSSAIKEWADDKDKPENVISEATYIFEPSTYSVIAHLERSMTQIAISQLILESKLAQYASRFRAMSSSHERATESKDSLHLAYNRAMRGMKDERLKEVVNGLKKARLVAGT